MKWRFKTNLKLVALIVLPLIFAALMQTFDSFRMLNNIAESVNRQEHVRSAQAAQSAIYSLRAGLEGIATDNAHWDDAAVLAYEPVDIAWLQQTWGVGTTDSNYDTVFVLDAKGQTIVGYHLGEKMEVPASEYIGPALYLALAALPDDNMTFTSISSFVQTPNGVAFFAIAPILPYSEGKKLKFEKPNYLLILKTVTADSVATLGQNFILHDLKLGPLNSLEDGGQIVPNRWGQPVAKLYWTDSNPGKAARDAHQLSVVLNILTLVGVMLPLALVHLSTLARIEKSEKQAHHSAHHDALSALPNRVLLIEEITKGLPLANTENGEMALAFIDLDGFKAVNDAYGHEIGDCLIKVVAEGLQKIAGDQFVVARLGGDEFALFRAGRDSFAETEIVAERILQFIREPFDLQGRIVSVGASIGLVKCNDPNMVVSEFMRQADIAMYDAKENGRNRWRKFNANLDLERAENLSIVAELRSILEKDLIEVAYQPFVSSRDREILGVEALARWPQSSHRKLGPDRFIALAEQHGLIDKLGMAILRKSCRDMSNWRDLKVAVNFSPLQIKRLSLVQDIQTVAAEFNFDLRRLEVEFTESVLIQNPDRAKIVIGELQALGVTVALDDFGTGYASVGYLHRFAFDKIKLDRSLTQSLSRGSMAPNIVQGTVLIAKGLSADVIAEGVETEEDATLMRLAGCELLQGYYFGKPQPLTALNDALLGHPTQSKSVSA